MKHTHCYCFENSLICLHYYLSIRKEPKKVNEKSMEKEKVRGNFGEAPREYLARQLVPVVSNCNHEDVFEDRCIQLVSINEKPLNSVDSRRE